MLERAGPEFSRLTTLRLGGHALMEYWPQTAEDFANLPEKARKLGARLMAIGRGSNILAAAGEHPLALVRLGAHNGIALVGEAEGKILVRAEAGAPLKRLLRFCLQNSLAGLEGLCGIPGDIGGSCAMNAGSFGVELGAKIHDVECYAAGEFRVFDRACLQLGYRHFRIKNIKELPIFTAVTFALTRGRKSEIFQLMNLNFIEKKSRQPLGAWSAGCAFKNPPGGESAGKLLEAAGFRGRRLGGMAFSPKHANFLVNEGAGTADAALELLEEARQVVSARYGVELEPEIRIIRWP